MTRQLIEHRNPNIQLTDPVYSGRNLISIWEHLVLHGENIDHFFDGVDIPKERLLDEDEWFDIFTIEKIWDNYRECIPDYTMWDSRDFAYEGVLNSSLGALNIILQLSSIKYILKRVAQLQQTYSKIDFLYPLKLNKNSAVFGYRIHDTFREHVDTSFIATILGTFSAIPVLHNMPDANVQEIASCLDVFKKFRHDFERFGHSIEMRGRYIFLDGQRAGRKIVIGREPELNPILQKYLHGEEVILWEKDVIDHTEAGRDIFVAREGDLYNCSQSIFLMEWENPSLRERARNLLKNTRVYLSTFFASKEELIRKTQIIQGYVHALEQKVEDRTQQYREQYERAEKALEELKATQSQLLAEEKQRRIYQVRAAQADAVARFLHQTSNLVLQPLASTMIVFEDFIEIIEDCRTEWGLNKSEADLYQELDESLERIQEVYPTAQHIIYGYRALFHAFYEIYVSTKPERDVNQDLRYIGTLVQNKYILTQVGLELELDQNIPPIKLEGGVQSIFLELMHNAARHGAKKILVKTIHNNEEGKVQVKFYNDGEPIPDGEWENVFSQEIVESGRGFGLTDAHYIVEALNNGRLYLAKPDREGFSVLFIIDFHIPAQQTTLSAGN